MTPGMVATIMFGLLIVLVALRVPVAFALAFSVLPILLIEPRIPPVMMLQRMFASYGSFILLSVPFFIMAANVMNSSGVTNRLIRLSKSFVGHLPGGLGHITVVVSMLFAGLSGSSTADAAGIGSVVIPSMVDNGYDKRFAVAVTSCSSVMGVIIPPSIIAVVWGGTMNVSVGGLFLAGVVPGVMIGLSQMVLVLFFAKKRRYPVASHISMREIVSAFKGSVLALFSPVIIIGGIVGGIVTPTEASWIAVIYSLILGLVVYRSIKLKDLSGIILKTAKLASLSLFAIGAAAIYGWLLAYYQLPGIIVPLVESVSKSPLVVLTLITAVFLIVGTFMDALPAMIIFGPLFAPLVSHMGISPLRYGITSLVALAFGLVTPPYGLCLLISSEIAGINSIRALKEVGIFLAAMLLILALIIGFPSISLILPNLFAPK
jgi:tripartite ATP-independent transporter DctM subunit